MTRDQHRMDLFRLRLVNAMINILEILHTSQGLINWGQFHYVAYAKNCLRNLLKQTSGLNTSVTNLQGLYAYTHNPKKFV